ncbi:hypothetical protein [Nostoc sp. 2RC]|jgi:hypothetical protein|uniref:hypothetical protein n=1 Tax=Nostoc sp. 2RC TaxID=2485484 RepID=UPI0016239C12|nr:hypothetical protein [Nostoc sp. 2RC]MBC1236186.1 hypothetical protein [Nostoc sp. 2RC]MBL1199906.1 hypothetical protein [Nostoc sp. GBBB01]
MVAKLIKCKLVSGTAPNQETYFFLGPKGLYIGGIATETGISEADENEQDKPNTTVKELLGSGVARRISVRSTQGTSKYTTKMLVAKSKAPTAEDGLIDKIISTDGTKVSGSKIVSVVNPRRATFY